MRTWLTTLLACALSFTVAACAASSSKGPAQATPASKAKEATRQEAREPSGEPKPAETPPGTAATAASEASAAAMSRSEISGERIEIRKAWIRIRLAPNPESQAIALAYGNDVLAVVKREGDWVQVRFAKNREGWIPADSDRP